MMLKLPYGLLRSGLMDQPDHFTDTSLNISAAKKKKKKVFFSSSWKNQHFKKKSHQVKDGAEICLYVCF